MANESRICFNNLAKNATLRVDTEATNHEKEKLTDEILRAPWRSTVITETTVNLDFGAAVAIQEMTLHNHNVVSGDTTKKWEASTDDFSSTSETEDVTLVTRTVKEKNSNGVLVDVTRNDLHHRDSWEYRYYRLRIAKASGSYIEAGQICVWKDSYQFDKNFVIGYTGGQENTFASSTGSAGQESNKLKHSRFICNMRFSNITDAQKDKLIEAGQSDFVAYFHGLDGNLYWGTFHVNTPENARTIDEVAPAEIWNLSATFVESL